MKYRPRAKSDLVTFLDVYRQCESVDGTFDIYDILNDNSLYEGIYFRKGTYLINQDFTFSEYSTLIFEPEAVLKIGENVTVTFDYTSVDFSGNHKIFDLSESGSILAGNITNDITPEMFGARGDELTDDTDAIHQANALASLTPNSTLRFPSTNNYKTLSPIVLSSQINIIMHSSIYYYGDSEITAITVGEVNIANREVKLTLSAKRKTLSDWSNEDNVGIKIYNATDCDIKIIYAQSFTIGLQLLGDGSGVSYSRIHLGTIMNNKIGLDAQNLNLGWVTENLFFGGRFGSYSGVNEGLSRYGVRITGDGITYSNNLVFHKPSFELSDTRADPGEAVPILVEYGRRIHFYEIRNESNSTTTMRISNNSRENYCSSGFGTVTIDENGTYPLNMGVTAERLIVKECKYLLYACTNLHKKACWYDGSTSVNIAGQQVVISTDGLPSLYKDGIGLYATKDYLSFPSSRGVGRSFRTETVKRFMVKRDYDLSTGEAGVLVVKCYDADGVLLTDTPTYNTYCKGMNSSMYYSTAFGGCYINTQQFTDDYVFVVTDDVKSIDIYISNVKLRGYAVYTDNENYAQSFLRGVSEYVDNCNVATTPPTATTPNEIGKVIFNATPSAGGPLGWICVSGGSPGTWEEFGNINLEGSTTWNPGNLVDGSGETSSNITVTGADLGDYVIVSAPYDLQGITCNAYVSAENTVNIRIQNETGGAIDLVEGDWKVKVIK